MFEELISNENGLWLGVRKHPGREGLELTFQLKGASACMLHWGIANRHSADWQLPPQSVWPHGSARQGEQAVQTPFQPDSDGSQLTLKFPEQRVPAFLVFDLFSPGTNRWENNRGRDFWLPLADPGPSPETELNNHLSGTPDVELVHRSVRGLDDGGELAVAVQQVGDRIQVNLVTDVEGPLWLHWGNQDRARARWKRPPATQRSPGTIDFDETAVRSPFEERQGLRWLTLEFSSEAVPVGIGCLLFQSGTGRWIKQSQRDLFLKISATEPAGAPVSELMSRIVEGEMGPHGWTLMHRFNLCHDLIDEAEDHRDAWATLFVWLRYSAVRQLDWQRNYNTKPKELSHAQERLTGKLADSFVHHAGQRDLIRLMLGCVGRGGDGQRIRDDILHIMHRHHIKEVGGTWMEQWHQKLHNNTTPDDIVICEAYLAFLRGNGDPGAYDRGLAEGGVTRERLASLERPITQNPEWHPHLKDGLIHDFENYLQLLRSVHSGTDLQTAANSAGHLLEGGARDALAHVQWHFGNPDADAVELASKITEARRGLASLLARDSGTDGIKAALYLDLALEEALRTAIERRMQSNFGNDQVLTLIDLVLSNLLLSEMGAELTQCRREWSRLPLEGRFSEDWCLRAKAVMDRLRRAAEAATDRIYRLLQPKAEQLGVEFEAAEWTITLFSEEIVRGRPLFLLSMLLHYLDPVVRKGARLGDWQVISPGRASGCVTVLEDLRSVQGRTFPDSTIIVADKVYGDEEPPEGVSAVITSKSVDLVSHVAVRARNANLLFATCFEEKTFDQLRSMEGKLVELTVTSSGDVTIAEGGTARASQARTRKTVRPSVSLPKPSLRVLRRSEFEPGLVGGKSWRIRKMAEHMPDAFQTPRSVALPFGVFEAVLGAKGNRKAADRYESLCQQLDEAPEASLAALRKCILSLDLPDQLLEQLRTCLKSEGFVVPAEFERVSQRIKQVWASLWNDRAYFSRRTNRLPHDAVSMAVLVQEVVEAEYAFVIHTVNPATGNREQLYAEVVRGLGETLVGNYPGRAMSVVVEKGSGHASVLAYPSKNVGLFGGGLIFRSDSNAEDLEGYAGAGLYESVLLTEPAERTLDYTSDPLVWDAEFQAGLFKGIGELGIAVEDSFGGAQDIEGAWTHGVFHVVQTRPQVGSK